MANLKPAHAAALTRLLSYTPPPTNYFSLPLSRRASVLILLYADPHGELRVVLTMRAKTLSSYAGHAALPGGHADSLNETPVHTARREAYEEIGLPLDDSRLPRPFRIRHLCQLPMNLARTELGVRPVVAYIEVDKQRMLDYAAIPSVENTLIPRLDAKEVAAVFTAPFEAFLMTSLPHHHLPSAPSPSDADAQAWYDGQWIQWYAGAWRMHNFYVPSSEQRVAWAEKPPTTMTMNRFRVFGMTARILVDAARVAYGREPAFEHNAHFGDEELIGGLIGEGRLGDKPRRRREGEESAREERDEAKI